MSYYYIYAHYTLDTGELFYIGKGKNNRHIDKCQRNKYWHNIVKKHGFKSEILIDKLEESDALIQEILAIKKFEPKANLTKGGVGGFTGLNSGVFKKGRKPWNKGKKCPQLSESQIGNKNHMFGKKSNNCKKIRCLQDNKVFNSIKECHEYYGISKSGIYKSLQTNTSIKNRSFVREES